MVLILLNVLRCSWLLAEPVASGSLDLAFVVALHQQEVWFRPLNERFHLSKVVHRRLTVHAHLARQPIPRARYPRLRHRAPLHERDVRRLERRFALLLRRGEIRGERGLHATG